MSKERYVGERRALWHFLSELQPLVEAALGDDALLRHRIDRSLKSGDLDSLRDARRMFHNLPEELKRRLMRGIFEEAKGQRASANADSDLPPAFETVGAKPPAAIRFSALPAARGEDAALSVELEEDEACCDAPVQVTIEPGTLPTSAAETLRQIANWIEHDRRLLSTQHWVRGDKRTNLSNENKDQA
ncbi:MAG: hypothetical protein ACR2QH_01500 [Geminicoccaceae bacterium]|jgi:hypothetical protein